VKPRSGVKSQRIGFSKTFTHNQLDQSAKSKEHRASPDYSLMLEEHRHIVSSLRGKPLPAALNGPLPCRPPPDPLQRCLFLPLEPERNRNVSLSAASMARPLGSEERKAGAIRKPAHRDVTVSKSRDIAG
jgi:hypothetical protein